MKKIFSLLFLGAFLVSSSLVAADEYYWQVGRTVDKAGAVLSSTLVLGKRSFDSEKGLKLDSQIYVSKEEGPVEYLYTFDAKSLKMEIASGGKKVGEGKFQCKGKLETNPHCNYEYQVTEGSPYSCKGSDHPVRKRGVLFQERGEMLYPSDPKKPVFWEADFQQTDEATYSKMKALFFAEKKN